PGSVQQGCGYHRAQPGFKESFAQGPGLRDANAHLLHQSGRAQSDGCAPPRIGASQEAALTTHPKAETREGSVIIGCRRILAAWENLIDLHPPAAWLESPVYLLTTVRFHALIRGIQ